MILIICSDRKQTTDGDTTQIRTRNGRIFRYTSYSKCLKINKVKENSLIVEMDNMPESVELAEINSLF